MSDLRDTAHGKEVAKGAEISLPELVRKMEDQFQMAMPRGMEATQLVRDALTLIRETPALAKCDGQSVLGGLMTMAQLGLRPGVGGQGWLVPFKDGPSQKLVAQLIIGYKGLIALGYRSDRVAKIVARTIHANDTYDIVYGTEDSLTHRPKVDGDPGAEIGYYAVCTIKDGEPVFLYMNKAAVEQHRDRYAKKDRNGQFSLAWRNSFESMAWKTCIRQLARFIPQAEVLAAAIEADEGVRFNTDTTTPPEAATYHYEGQVVSEEVDPQ